MRESPGGLSGPKHCEGERAVFPARRNRSATQATDKEKVPMACERISDAGAFAYGWIPVDAMIQYQ